MKIGHKVLLTCLLMVAIAGSFFVYLTVEGRWSDFQQFILDRREGAGQTQPDKNAECQFNFDIEKQVQVKRKAHGQKEVSTIDLAGTLIKPFIFSNKAVFYTGDYLVTYDCTNDKHVAHDLGDRKIEITNVQASASGSNIAASGKLSDGKDWVGVYQFSTLNPDSSWNTNFGPEDAGIEGQLVDMALEGESLVVVFKSTEGLAVHTYNYRRSHAANPWNGHDQENQSPLLVATAENTELEFTNLGKGLTVTTSGNAGVSKFSYNFNCKLDKDGVEELEKPCEWKLSAK